MPAAPELSASLLTALHAKLALRALADGSAVAQPGESEPAVEATVWRALALRLGSAEIAPARRRRARRSLRSPACRALTGG